MKLKLVSFLVLSQIITLPAVADLKVHEWGTFTSVQGANGEAQTGLEHEEEALPDFVHSLNENAVMGRCGEGCRECVKGMCMDDIRSTPADAPITQKMETPVLYFYSPTPTKVDVTVDFPKGLISQYFPLPTTVLPKLQRNMSLANGQIHYKDLEIATGPAEFPAVLAGNVYGPARETKANPVRTQFETEKFIFYRGIGNFTTSLKVTSDYDRIVFEDTAGAGIPFILAVNIRDGKGGFTTVGSLPEKGSKALNMVNFNAQVRPIQDLAKFEVEVMPKLVSALVASGLYEDEARAMVNTWKLSYFHTEGLRVLYVLPRKETDQILPIKISPAPTELVRTLVGRIEILTHQEERALLLTAEMAVTRPDGPQQFRQAAAALGRFREPKLKRVLQLTDDAKVKNAIQSQIY